MVYNNGFAGSFPGAGIDCFFRKLQGKTLVRIFSPGPDTTDGRVKRSRAYITLQPPGFPFATSGVHLPG